MTQSLPRNSHVTRLLGSLLVAVLLLPAATARAQTPADGQVSATLNPTITPDGIMLNETVSVAGLIDYVANKLDISFIWDGPTELIIKGQGRATPSVTIRMQRPIREDELFGVLQAVLQSTQPAFAIVETAQPDLYRLVQSKPGADVPSDHVYILGEDAVLPDTEVTKATVVTAIVRMDGGDPAIAGPLNSVLNSATGGGKYLPLGTTGLVMLTGQRSRVETALELIRLLPDDPDELTLEVIELQNLEPTAAQQALTPVFALLAASQRQPGQQQRGGRPSTATVTPIPGTRKIVIVAPRSFMEEVRRIVAEFDSGEAPSTEIYTQVALPAADLADLIQQLFTSGTGPRGQTSRATVQQLGTTVLVNATRSEHSKVEDLIAKLESLPAHQRQIVKYFTVRNRPAGEILDVLDGLFAEGAIEGTIDRGTAPSQDVEPGITRRTPRRAQEEAVEQLAGRQPSISLSSEEEILLDITLDENTNTLLVRGEPAMVDQVGQIIEDLDVRQPQVMLDVYLVFLSEEESLQFGVELSGQFDVGATTMNLASLFGLGLTDAIAGTGSPGTGFTGLAVNPGDFAAIVRALETVTGGKATSTPRILVNNNEEASLEGINTEPFSEVSQGETTTTTGFGGTEDAGTILSITPQIAEGNHLILEYDVELSAFTGDSSTLEGGGVLPPPTRRNKINSVVTIPDGFTVIVGGLEDITERETVTKVPFLGDIPLLGELFKSTNKSELSNRLYVFIRATILRDPTFQDLRYMSSQDLVETGIESGLPPLEPVWIN